MRISLCMIVKDEEEVLARCLDSVKALVDEIVIVDTGSTDGTKKIARNYTDDVYDFAWRDDFSAARNFSFSKATGDYILWLDADDTILQESAVLFPSLRELLERDSPDVVSCPYDAAAGGNLTFYRERFLKRSTNPVWQGRVHECIPPTGSALKFPIRVTHLGSSKPRGARNLHIYQKWAAEEKLDGRDLFYYGRELYYNRLYTEGIAVLEEMLGGAGWYVNKIEACKILGQCHAARGDLFAAKAAYFRSFCYGEPRASLCFEIAELFRAERKFGEATFWYKTALRCRSHAEEGDFEEPSCRGVASLVGLTCCAYARGDEESAIRYHIRAETLDPNHPAVVYNRAFFKGKGLLGV